METKERAAEAKHPLADWRPVIEENWERDWLPAFESETSIAKKIGMLYIAFDLNVDANKVIRYFLSIAEGFHGGISGTDNLEYPHAYDTPYGRKRIAQLRAVVAEKAFTILCARFFKNEKGDGYEPSWANYVRNIDTMEQILEFFRLEKSSISRGFENLNYHATLRNEHHVEVAAKFMRQLIEYAWPANRSINDWGEEFQRFEVFEKYYPCFIEILHGLGRVDLLLAKYRFEWLSNRCLAVLNELAFIGRKECKTLEEAMLHGSVAARVVLNAKIMWKEKKRQRAIRRAKLSVQKAEEELKKLKV